MGWVPDPTWGVAAETLHHWRVRECVGVSWPPPTSASPSFLSFFLFTLSPSPPPPLTKALCTQPLPLAAVSEPRPYENHMGERGWRRRGWGSWPGPAPPASIIPLPSGCVAWQLAHFAPNSPNWILVAGVRGTEGKPQSRAGGPEGDWCSRTTSLRLEQGL